jgi:hypothetical protein
MSIHDTLKNFAHIGAVAAAVTVANQLQSGAAVTSGNVVIPGLAAGGFAILGAFIKGLMPQQGSTSEGGK